MVEAGLVAPRPGLAQRDLAIAPGAGGVAQPRGRGEARQGEGAALGVTLADRLGQPLSGFSATARLRHPATSAQDHAVTLNERQPGRYEAGFDQIEAGSWILELRAKRGEEVVFVSRSRITLPEK